MSRKNKKVFLSYGHQDRPFVRFLASDIRATRVELWIDDLEILPGDSLIGKISKGLADSDYVLACLSQTSVQSNWVRTELEIAATRGIRERRALVLPLLVDDVELKHIPAFLSHLWLYSRICGQSDD
ncbi:MAG TPA: toll/interleukin-1 receptor domain-containing protein [Bryobacteraceae bacterium]|nr:toll/interleukin-1 receptor domain-containing protein [Bryobacteraceae bacterium]